MDKLSVEDVDELMDDLHSEINSLMVEVGVSPVENRVLDCLAVLHGINNYLIKENEINKQKINSLSQRNGNDWKF